MNIGILGTRGVPPRYGGFETFAAELGTRLVGRGHRVAVYCRNVAPALQPAHEPTESRLYDGIDRIVLPAIRHKYFETVSHAFFSVLDAVHDDFDVVLVCNAANAFVLPLLRAARIPTAINVDGIERHRRKWNALGRAVYRLGERMSVVFASRIIADAEVIAHYYREHFAAEPAVIPYGADFPQERDSDILPRLGLTPRNYILYVSRFEPENNPLEVVLAYEKLADGRWPLAEEGKDEKFADGRWPLAEDARNGERRTANGEPPPLVMVGEGLYAKDLVRELQRHRSDRILFPGALYGADYRTLQRNALVYIQATEVGGTHPAMIEAMGSGGAVLAHDTPENREVGGDAVRYFDLRPLETLSGTLHECLRKPLELEEMRKAARQRVEERYQWEKVTSDYERLFAELVD